MVGKVVRMPLERPEGRKIRWQSRMNELEHALRLQQIAQPVVAEIEKLGPCGKGATGQLLHRLRQENLAAMSG